MRPQHLVTLLVLPAVLLAALLTLAGPAAPAHAGGVVSVCDEAHLRAALASGGMVTFSCSGTITLTATIVIAADTTIDGSGQTVTLSGNQAVRVFIVNEGLTLNLKALTVTSGGILNDGTLTVSNSTFSGNHADSGGGGVTNWYGTVVVSDSTFSDNSVSGAGGGIYNNGGTVTVNDSTFSGNSAAFHGCGGIYNGPFSTLTVRNSIFSGNDATKNGGGICNLYRATLTVSNSTFSGNTAEYGGGMYNNSGTVMVSNSTFSGNRAVSGGGIRNFDGTTTLKNTIVADSPAGGSCSGTITDGGGNLSYPDASCPGINADPKLGPLQDNGGPIWTMALLPGSAAIDAADDAICAAPPVNNLDQRGVARPQGPHCDIGAYEAILPPRAYLPVIMR